MFEGPIKLKIWLLNNLAVISFFKYLVLGGLAYLPLSIAAYLTRVYFSLRVFFGNLIVNTTEDVVIIAKQSSFLGVAY